MRRLWAVAATAVAIAAAGCGGDESNGEPVKPLGREWAGSTVQFANCGDWRRGTRAQRLVTVEQLRDALTPQRSRSASSPLPDVRAYELIQGACGHFGESVRLYKLYVRMQGFAPLSQ